MVWAVHGILLKCTSHQYVSTDGHGFGSTSPWWLVHLLENIYVRLAEIYDMAEEYLRRPLKPKEKDYLWIRARCGNWGTRQDLWDFIGPDYRWKSELGIFYGMSVHNKPNSFNPVDDNSIEGDTRYIARPGNPVDWQPIREYAANKIVGILFVPEHHDKKGKNYCAQFVGKRIYKIWLRKNQAENCVKKMVAGNSLLTAVELSLDIPLTQLETELIKQIMGNRG